MYKRNIKITHKIYSISVVNVWIIFIGQCSKYYNNIITKIYKIYFIFYNERYNTKYN